MLRAGRGQHCQIPGYFPPARSLGICPRSGRCVWSHLLLSWDWHMKQRCRRQNPPEWGIFGDLPVVTEKRKGQNILFFSFLFSERDFLEHQSTASDVSRSTGGSYRKWLRETESVQWCRQIIQSIFTFLKLAEATSSTYTADTGEKVILLQVNSAALLKVKYYRRCML